MKVNILVQPFHMLEPKVIVAKSNVHGLGVFTRRRVFDGEVICMYSGVCVDDVHLNESDFLVEGWWENKATGKKERWYLDARDSENTAGRWINDAGDRYGKNFVFQTEYSTNCYFHEETSEKKHDVTGKWYVNVIAIGDINIHTELFCSYGKNYWNRIKLYGRDDPHWVSH